MRFLKYVIFFFAIFLLASCSVNRLKRTDSISPLDYGLKEAQTGVERYEILFKTHEDALRLGKGVDYSGIKKIDLEIPQGAKSIPLSEHTNFRGVTITVVNNSKTFFLFEYKNKMVPVSVSAKEVDNCRYNTPNLRSGLFLLSITDNTPWVVNREGFNYGAIRKDIILIENGTGKDTSCSSYSTEMSSPVYSYCRVTNKEKTFSNLTFKRLPGSEKLTKLVRFSCENNVVIENISITTPEGHLYGDQAICVEECTNVLIKDITINGSYSTSEKFGYGISMNNVWNVTCKNIQSKTAWGVFGTNNTHKVHLEDCNINRFDVHCYGKDVLCDHCTFNGIGGVYSSVLGTIEYRNCIFNDACPYINRPDYNAYVNFNIILRNCTFISSNRHTYLFNLQAWDEKINERKELNRKCWPNVTIENLTVYIHEGIKAIELFRLPHNITYALPVGGISTISINGLTFKYADDKRLVALKLSSTEVQIEKHFTCTLEGLNLLPEMEETLEQRKKNDYLDNVIINIKSEKGEDINISNSRL